MRELKLIPSPTYLYSREEAELLAAEENVIKAKGPIPFVYSDVKKAKKIIIDFRQKKGLGVIIQIMPNDNLGKMKTLDISMFNAICPYTGVYLGRYLGMKGENHQWNPVTMTNIPRILNLNRDNDLADWMVIRLNKYLHGSFYNEQLKEKSLFYVKDEKADMTKGYNDAEVLMQVFDLVKSLNAEMLLMVAREVGLGLSPGAEDVIGFKEVSGFIYSVAMKEPSKVYDIINDKTAAIKSIFSSALYTGAIFQDVSGFTFNGALIGRTKEEVIQQLQADKNMFQMISIRTKNSDAIAKKLEKEMDIIAPDEDLDETKKTNGF